MVFCQTWSTASWTAAGRSTTPDSGGAGSSRATSRARSSSTWSVTSRRRPERAAATRCPTPSGSPPLPRARGSGRRRSSSPTARFGGAERLWWLLRPLRPRRVRGARSRGLARPADRGRGTRSSRHASSRASAPATRSPARELAPQREQLVVVDARLEPHGAASRTPSTASRAASQARSTARGTKPAMSHHKLFRPATSSRTAGPGSRPACLSTVSPSPEDRRGSTQARGRSGSISGAAGRAFDLR